MLDAFAKHSSIASIEVGINALMERYNATAGNIANAGTPNYLAKEVSFEDDLKRIQDKLRYNTEPELTQTDEGHFHITANSIYEAKVEIAEPDRDFMTTNNTVDLEREILTLGKTAMKYRAVATMARKTFEGLNSIIRG
ncbi:MAG: flagellar basal body rod protein FlgB [Cyanobacteria bacterium REEB446]|nr:flagellar basal body rod protein FlgB [Cyanobacteria bacterium REEB446]